MSPRAAVIFDLDGVLIDSEGLQYRAYSEALRCFGFRVSREVYAREWIAAGHGSEYAVTTFDLPVSPDELKARKNPIYHRMLSEGVSLMPGAAEAVARMAEHFALAVATNSNQSDTELALGRTGLRPHFDAVVTRERYERPKPAPDAFLAAARALDVPRARCLVVEDSERGVRAASAAGIPAVAVPNEWTRGSDFALAFRRIETLHELTLELAQVALESAGDGPGRS
jgi:HAD superfamily hydrolase (TIGR01509 family)